MIYLIFLLLTIATIITKYQNESLYRILKPLNTTFIILIPFLLGHMISSVYAYAIFSGLIFSLVGDLFLLNHNKYFKFGLASFMITHAMYLFAIYSLTTKINSISFLFFLILILISFRVFKAVLDSGIIIYIVFISAMVAISFNLFMTNPNSLSKIIFLAGGLFIISDFTLALNKFLFKFPTAETIILSTYYLAQFLFALTI